ncbi:unnamed protein product [Citrullus colocynthis]|uniref:Uncharacterized protein n=1 Tax=Citrullus colocynthis TaxID=252529 RepID=A0ABP0YNP6_9ROSI
MPPLPNHNHQPLHPPRRTALISQIPKVSLAITLSLSLSQSLPVVAQCSVASPNNPSSLFRLPSRSLPSISLTRPTSR